MRVSLSALTAGRIARAAVAFTVATVAIAGLAGTASAAGDNGDVKIHDAITPDSSQEDDPKVCTFYVVGYNFDLGQEVSWRIQEGPSFGEATDPGVLEGELVADASGFAKSELLSLPNGHYKLWWNFVPEQGEAKFKVFKVDCAPSPSVSLEEVCDEDGSGLLITLGNEGEDPATFVSDAFDSPIVVDPGDEVTVEVPVEEGADYSITVTEVATGTTWTFDGNLDCLGEPAPGAGFTESCDDGGVIISLDNVGDADAVFTVVVDVNGETDQFTETVAPGEAVEILIELAEGDAYSIEVTDEDGFLAFAEGTFECEEEEEEPPPTEEPPPSPSVPDRGGSLPKTGAGFPVGTATLLGALLLASGVALIKWRDDLLTLYRRRH